MCRLMPVSLPAVALLGVSTTLAGCVRVAPPRPARVWVPGYWGYGHVWVGGYWR